jgi:hypothetical protein
MERTMEGLEARLKSRGAGRWGGAGFLGVWLAFWTVGEGFVLWILIAGGWALATGRPLGSGNEPLQLAPAVLTGVFLICWLAFWTFGGLMAWHEFFRLLWSADRLVGRSDGLVVARQVGPFTKRRFLPLGTLRGFFRIEAHTSVNANTTDGVVELTRNGTPAEQDKLIAAFVAELRLPGVDLPPILPSGWREVRAFEGDDVLVKDPAARRTAARVMWLIALPLVWSALTVIGEAREYPGYAVPAALLAAVAGLALWGAGRLTWARDEWRLERGRIARQRRFGSRRREVFSGNSLRLTESTDSDGDRWFRLDLRGDNRTQRLQHVMNDPTEPRQLGRWLAARTGVPFIDDATPEQRTRTAAEEAARRAEQLRMLREWLKSWVQSLPVFGRRKD